MPAAPTPIRSQPGIRRDGTRLDGGFYTDGQWCRFQRGLPRKMGGYKSISTLPQAVRGMDIYSLAGVQYLHFGQASFLSQVTLDSSGNLIAFNDRTPGSGFTPSVNNLWQFAEVYNTAISGISICAHPGQNLTNIDSNTPSDILYGPVQGNTALTDTSVAGYSGGILAVGPYLFAYGSGGAIGWSLPNQPNVFTGVGSGAVNVTDQKIVTGVPIRGTGGGPAALFWSLNSLIRCLFQGAPTYFSFDTLTSDISIISSQSVIEEDGIYYWPGVDRFMMFNGICQEIPNDMNQNWFFDNLNRSQRQKIFAVKVPRYGEIWWCYPRGSATECTHAIIFNPQKNWWYDTQLPIDGRTAAQYANVFGFPYMMSATYNSALSGYQLWQHETGYNQVVGSNSYAIDSWFETHEMSLVTQQQAQNKGLRVGMLEPDFVQSGPLSLTINGRANARAPVESSQVYTVVDPTLIPLSDPQQQINPVKEVRRLMSFRFESNVVGGNYQMGNTLAHLEPADARVTG